MSGRVIEIAPAAILTLVPSSRSMCSDGHRALISIVFAIVVPVMAGLVTTVVAPERAGTSAATVVFTLLGWNVFAAVYVVLTARTFTGLDADAFRACMEARSTLRGRAWRWLDPRGDGPTYAVESAIVAFAVVLVVPHINAIRVDDWLLVPITLSILVTSWALSVVSYALHYAQYDLQEPGLEFPGDRAHAYNDYLYFSIGVATTLGVTDVNITTPRMRRIVNLHTILTFLYNSVIIALLAAVLIR